MAKKLKVYLAGKMSGLSYEDMSKWRRLIRSELRNAALFNDCDITVINPVDYYNFEERRYQSELEVEEYDLAHVISSDVLVVNLEGLNTSDGTKFEIWEARRNHGIPVIAFGDRSIYENLHPWIKNKITRVEESIDDVVAYIRDFYMV